jgi:hypothetical protein
LKTLTVKGFALHGLILFIGIAVAPSINADVQEPITIEPELVEQKFENLVGLVEGIISYYERTYGPMPDDDCGCEDIEPTPWPFPALCTLLVIPYILLAPINLVFVMAFGIPIFGNFIVGLLELAASLNCYWQ